MKQLCPRFNVVQKIQIPGIVFGREENEVENRSMEIQNLDGLIKRNHDRALSIFGDTTIINLYGLKMLNLIARLLPLKHIKKLNAIIFQYLRAPRKIEQLARTKLTANTEEGVLRIPDMVTRFNALRTMNITEVHGKQLAGKKEPHGRNMVSTKWAQDC